MRKLNINLPKYRLFLEFRLIKRRKSIFDEALIPSVSDVKKKYRKGSLPGRFFRHIFEHKNIRKVLASNLALIVVTTSLVPQTGVQAQEVAEESVIETQTNLVTEKSVQYPVKNIKITQGFSFYHPGIDLDGVTGDAIKSIKPGKVSAVSYSRFAYGNSVLIEHANQVSSLYAHLSKIEVETDQEVTMDTEIGKMGATGHAFGDHLHLEIHDHGRAVNPLSVLR